jgi:iron complex transport system substrate-binding protein
MAELAAAVPAWKQAAVGGGWQLVNLEQIFAWNPEQIYIVSYDADSAQIAAQLRSDPQWQGLEAVKKGHVYGFAGDIFSWDQPDPRWILGQIWLAKRVHPDRFRDWDILQEMSQFFSEMYGLEAASTQRDIVPNLKGDLQ